MHYFKKQVDDPTSNRIIKEILSLIVAIAIGVAFTLGADRYQCTYLAKEPQDTAWTNYSIIVSFWSILAIPVMQYLLYAINDSTSGFMRKVLGTQLKYLACMVHTISIEIVLKMLYSTL